jgi:drug/metabolite transporter (DMT)-like permease
VTPEKASANRRGMAFMVIAMALFAANDAGTKFAAATLPVSEIMTIRGGFALAFLLIVLLWRGELGAWPQIADWQVSLRGGAEAVTGILLISALALIPFGNVIAIIQLVPFVMTVIGAYLLREAVGWRRWLAVGAGFGGVLLVVKPATAGFDMASLLALTATLTILLRDMLARAIGSRVPAFIVALASIVAGIAIGLAGLAVQSWSAPDLATVAVLGAAGICLVLAQFFIVVAYRDTELSAVAPFRYSIVAFAVIYGLVFFAELPDAFSLGGMAIMIAAGIYMLHRERLRSRG